MFNLKQEERTNTNNAEVDSEKMLDHASEQTVEKIAPMIDQPYQLLVQWCSVKSSDKASSVIDRPHDEDSNFCLQDSPEKSVANTHSYVKT